MKRFDAVLKAAVFGMGAILLLPCAFAESVEVSRCVTRQSNWPVIMGWQNGTLMPKKIIIEISQESPAGISGGDHFFGFDPRMPFSLDLNDTSDAGDYFPEEGFDNHNPEITATRSSPPRKYQTLLESKMLSQGSFIYTSSSSAVLHSPKTFKIVIQTQSTKDRSLYYVSDLDCENILKK